MSDAWDRDELRASVQAYIEMLGMERSNQPYIKKQYYRALAEKYGQTEKAFEYRMQNVSYVMTLMGRDWITGLKPAKNVGAKVAAEIEGLIAEEEGKQSLAIAAFEIEVREARRKKLLNTPVGNLHPVAISSSMTQFQRNPAVKAWILQQANGQCEACGQLAPFNGSDGEPFLEVHHLRQLADQGSDTVSNAVALCPNCHREAHYGENSKALMVRLYERVTRLVRE